VLLSSGGYEALHDGLSLALSAVALGRPVAILLMGSALYLHVEGHLEQAPVLAAPEVVARRLRDGFARRAGPTLDAMLEDARRLGTRVYACSGAVDLLDLAAERVVERVDEVISLPGLLQRLGPGVVVTRF